MRLALVWLCISATAAADVRDVMEVRPDLKAVRGTVWTPAGGKLVETGLELRTYDASGRLVRHESRERGAMKVSTTYTWDAAGRMRSSTYRDASGRKEVRELSYKVDANGRVVERTLRDPAKPPGELIRYQYIWQPDGSHSEQAYRHYAKEGPYRSDVQVFDARGRLTRDCAEHGGCDMIEYNAHGDIDRIRQQNAERHYYLVYDNTYDRTGHLATQILGGTQTDYTWNARGDIAEVVTRRIPAQGGAVERKTVYTYDYR